MDQLIDHHVYPNLNSEVYRNLTDRLSVTDKQLQVLLINEDGTMFIGASNMTDRYWNGTISVYDSVDLKRNEPLAVKKTETGISNAVYLTDNKYIVGEDSGIIQIVELKTNDGTKTKKMELVGYVCNHDSSVMTISVFQNKQNFVTGGMDYSIKIWDAGELSVHYSYLPAHTDVVSSVATQPKSNNVFASCCWAGEALIWDIRNSKHAKELYTAKCGLSVLEWKPDNENILVLGQDDGSLQIMDIRNPSEILSENQIFQKRIQQIKYHPEKTNIAAICADDVKVKIMDCEQDHAIIMEDNLHVDFVRSLAWNRNELLSCSWDNTIQKRSLHST